jgi:orotate phosphoribosyltransferase
LTSAPPSGLVFSAALAYELEKPHTYARTESKSHGTNKTVEGYLQSGSEVLLLDDVVSIGVSISKAADIISANGGIMHNFVASINREERGRSDVELNEYLSNFGIYCSNRRNSSEGISK